MFCQACGADNDGDARFCNMCGTVIAKPGSPGGIVPDGTALGIGAGAPEAPKSPKSPADRGAEGAEKAERAKGAIEPPSASAPARPSKSVWEDDAGASAPARSYGGGLTAIGSETLAGVGVKSSGRAWVIIGTIAVVLVALGALGGALLSGDVEPVEEDYDPDLEESQAEIGLPLPEGVDFPDTDPTAGEAPTGSVTESSAGAPNMGPATGPTGEPPSTTTVVTGSGNASPTMRPTGGGTSATSGTSGTSGTTMETESGGGTNTGMAPRAGTTMEGTSTRPTMADRPSMSSGSGTGGGTTMGTTGTVPREVPEERDIAMEMYSQRVRFVIARYYASRAQTCFDLATRNTPDLRGEVRIRLTIGADGQVTDTSAVRNTTGNETLGQCLAGRVRRWRLPPPPGGELTLVLPFRN